QDALARRIGIKQATLSNFENHPDKTTLTTLFKILQSLGVVMTLNAKATETAPAPDNNTDLDW
ncbi:type II toxin-antitoxin system antitoxin HipB, partial [Acinetobacter baumannii]